MTERKSLEQIRAEAAAHEQQLASYGWLTTADLAQRWNVDPRTVRAIPRAALPYLDFGCTKMRRYCPADVAAYEREAKNPREGGK